MLDEVTIRRQLEDYRGRLARMDDERSALTEVVRSLESLLKAVGLPDHTSGGPPTFPPPRPKVSTPVGTVSMRSAVAQVMREANGRPLHTREVMARAQAMGASTNAKVPLSVVDLVLLGLLKKGSVEKVAPRTWRWTEVEPRKGVSAPSRSAG
jgi:hypothetical protein